jgi:PilZ domain
MLKLVRSPDDKCETEYATNEKRYAVLLGATLTFDGVSKPVFARICDISEGGLKAVTAILAQPKDRVIVTLSHFGELSGQIAWSRNTGLGIQLDQKIDPYGVLTERALRAAQSAKEAAEFANLAWRNMRPVKNGIVENQNGLSFAGCDC